MTDTQEQQPLNFDPNNVQQIMDRLHKALWEPFTTVVDHEQYREGASVDEKLNAIMTYLTGLKSTVLGSILVTQPDMTEEKINMIWDNFTAAMSQDFDARKQNALNEFRRVKQEQLKDLPDLSNIAGMEAGAEVMDIQVVEDTPPKV